MEEHDIRSSILKCYAELVRFENESIIAQALITHARVHGGLLKIKDTNSPEWKSHLRLKAKKQLLTDYILHLMEAIHALLEKLKAEDQ